MSQRMFMSKLSRRRTLTRLVTRTLFVLCLIGIPSLIHLNPHVAHASSTTGNIVNNPGFEQGSSGWGFTQPPGCEGTGNAVFGVDPTQWAEGSHSGKVSTGALTQTGGCSDNPNCPCPTSGRAVGFSQFGQNLPSTNFTQLTDSANGFNLWFQLQPTYNGIAAFEIRICGACDGPAELDYVINPDPSVGTYPANSTSIHILIFHGYQPGQWYHFSRDLKADWMMPMGGAPGLSLKYNFTLLLFAGFATQNGSAFKSEDYWLDDVRIYTGANPPPPDPTHYTSFNFTDTSGNNVDNLVKWKLLDSTGQPVTYTFGQSTLPTGPYWLQGFYLDYFPDTQILYTQLHLDTKITIPLAMIQNSSLPRGYVALNNPVSSLTASHPNPSALQFTIQVTQGIRYTMLVGSTIQPKLVQANGVDVSFGSDWTYNAALALNHIEFTTTSGTETVTLYLFKTPLRQPPLSFNDRAGQTLNSQISFRILDSQGNRVPYSPGAVLPSGTFFVEAYYEGFRIYRSPLDTNQTTPIVLDMFNLSTSSGNYLALNSTGTNISIELSSSKISFRFEGSGPYLILINVDQKPLRVERDGQPIFWLYNATDRTVSIETPTAGSFQLVMVETASYGYLYMAGAAAVVVTAVIGIVVWRLRVPKKKSSDDIVGEHA